MGAGVAERVGCRGGPPAGRRDGPRDALDRQVAGDARRAGAVDGECRGDELDLGVVGDVEELRRQNMCAELFGRTDRDRIDLRGSLEAAMTEPGLDLGQAPAEDRDALVAD